MWDDLYIHKIYILYTYTENETNIVKLNPLSYDNTTQQRGDKKKLYLNKTDILSLDKKFVKNFSNFF